MIKGGRRRTKERERNRDEQGVRKKFPVLGETAVLQPGCEDALTELLISPGCCHRRNIFIQVEVNIFAFEPENQRFRAGNNPPLLWLVQMKNKAQKGEAISTRSHSKSFAELGQRSPSCMSFLIPLHLSRAPLWVRCAVARRDLSMTSDDRDTRFLCSCVSEPGWNHE